MNSINSQKVSSPDNHDLSDNADELDEFYTPANELLVNARSHIIEYSISNAKERLDKERGGLTAFVVHDELVLRRQQTETLRRLELLGSQIISEKPVSTLVRGSKLNDASWRVLSGSWDGKLSILDSQTLEVLSTVNNAHIGKTGKADWAINNGMVITGAEDRCLKFWDFKSDQNCLNLNQMVFDAHESRISDVKIHPSKKYVSSASFDSTWKLWDIEKKQELLLQEGHSKELLCIGWQDDGSLICSGGIDKTGIIWDVRSGNSIMNLVGHAKSIFCLDWSLNGHQVATGSGDGTIKVWDLRNIKNVDTILAHQSVVTSVQFGKDIGKTLVSGGYDKVVNIYNCDSWRIIKSLKGHSDKLLSVTYSEKDNTILSTGWDCSLKCWSVEQIHDK